jgi:hypothetical protein
MTQDAGQQVVEVVRHATGELAELAGPAEVREPLCQGPPVRHVGRATAVAEKLAIGQPARLTGRQDPTVLAVAVQETALEPDRPAPGHRAGVLDHHLLPVIRVHQVQPGPSQQLTGGAAGELPPALIQVVAGPVGTRGPEQGGYAVVG